MKRELLQYSINPYHGFRVLKFLHEERKMHPLFLRNFGTMVFCGAQGEGKTLSAVQYVLHLLDNRRRCILVTNIAIKGRPFNAYLKQHESGNFYLHSKYDNRIITTDTIKLNALSPDFKPITVEYTGLDMLKNVNNSAYGVIFLIDEIHLELNSLESKNIDIEVMVEISQQRKQRKHIVGTSQVFMRMAKPLREQIHDIIICKNYFKILQYNKWILGETVQEENGKIKAQCKGRFLWFHQPEYYDVYDTYAKMKRYNKEWQGRKRVENMYGGVANNEHF